MEKKPCKNFSISLNLANENFVERDGEGWRMVK